MEETTQSSHLDVATDSTVPCSRRIEVLFEFSVTRPKLTLYRAVRATGGGFRIEKRGENSKRFKTVMWCGSKESLFKFQEAIESQFRK